MSASQITSCKSPAGFNIHMAPLRPRERCIALDDEANQCRRRAVTLETIHSDPEWDRRWMRAAFCPTHAKENQ
jgi:hypothetical protein